jgi:hypothetical protein
MLGAAHVRPRQSATHTLAYAHRQDHASTMHAPLILALGPPASTLLPCMSVPTLCRCCLGPPSFRLRRESRSVQPLGRQRKRSGWQRFSGALRHGRSEAGRLTQPSAVRVGAEGL